MSEIIRLVVCQLECHPAFYRDRLACLEEPFMPESYKASLSHLGSLGIPITTMQESFKEEYLKWHKKRLQELLKHPLMNEDIPCLIVFPEGSIPVDCLQMLHEFAKSKNATIIAGSHTILDTVEAKQIYSALGKADAFHKRHTHYHDAAFIFAQDKIHEQKKQGVSPFNRVDTSALSSHRVTLHPIPIRIGSALVKMVPLVCADALQLPNIKGDYDIVSIISYDPQPTHFDSFIGTQVGNNKVVIYCNDRKFGGSSINFPLDKRPISWLFEAPLSGKVPKGEVLLIIDVPISRLATQVGVFNPEGQHQIKMLVSITHGESAKADQEVSRELCQIEQIPNNQARNSRIDSILKKRLHNPLQKRLLDYLLELSRTGTDTKDVWGAYGHDIILELKGLIDLEAEFAEICQKKLLNHFVEGNLEPQSLESLQTYLRNCKSRIPTAKEASFPISRKAPAGKGDYINRDEEITKLLTFLDSGKDSLLEVTGLPQIGKSAVIETALSRTSLQRVKRIPLLSTSTAEYIIAEITGKSTASLDLRSTDLINYPQFQEAIKDWDVLWLENCLQLVLSEKWKSSDIEKVIKSIVSIVQGGPKTKIIFESSAAIPFDFHDPSILSRMRIWGFERELIKHGVGILDRQLRRLSLNPIDIAGETKIQLVKDLGGHPMAIIFCADAVYEEGLNEVIEATKRGTGFYREVTDRILNMVSLSENDKRLLRILSGCRIEVSRDAVSATCDFSATEHITNLVRLCLIDVVSPNSIRLPGILRNRFRFNDLDEKTRDRLHKNAAMMYTQMAKENPSRLEFAVEAEYHSAAIDQTSKVSTDLIDGRLGAVKKFYEEHNYAKANKALNPLLTGYPSDEVLRLSALIDAALGDLAPALAKAEKLLRKNSSDNYLFSVLGKAALTQSRPELGDTLVAIGRKVGVAETRVSILEGRLALRRRDFSGAEICFQHAIVSPRTDPWAYYYLGITYLRMGNLREAINVLYDGDEYLASNPRVKGHARNAIRAKLGVAYVLNGDLDAASTILENLKQDDPDNPETLYAYWLLIIKKEGVERAEEAFEVFKNANPKRWERGLYHLYYGLFLKALDKQNEANEHFDLAHKNEPNNVYIMIQYAENLYSLALRARKELDVELSKDRALKCAQMVQRIFEFDPDNASAGDLQVDLYCEFGIQLSETKR